LEGTPPAWASWESADNYLPDAFYDPKSSSSLSALIKWAAADPITAEDNMLASYKQVELVILSFGLAFRALWIAEVPLRYSDVPTHVLNSPYPFSQYEQLSHSIADLIAGYADTYVPLRVTISQWLNYLHRFQEIEAAYPALRLPKAKSSMEGSSKTQGRRADVNEADAMAVKDVVGRKVGGKKRNVPQRR
jgi:hypothetical protein